MKRFIFNKYSKYMSSLSEWSSSIYVYNKKNFFLINNSEEKVYDLFYNYFNLNLSFVKTEKKINVINLNFLKNNFISKFILKKVSFIENILCFYNIKRKEYIYFLHNDNIEKERSKNITRKLKRFTRLFKYRIRKKYLLKLFKNRSINKVFVSKPEIRFSVNEIMITLYVYNREKFYFLNKLSKLNKLFFNLLKKNRAKKSILLNKLKKIDYSFKYIKNGIVPKFFNSKLLYFKENLYNYSNLFKFYDFKNMFEKSENIYILFNFNNNKYILNNIKKIFSMNLKKVFLYKFYISIIYLNNYKFNNNNLMQLKNKLHKIYKKKININIINLKYSYLENSIFINGLINKLNDRKKKVLKVIRKALSLGKIVKLHPLFFRLRKKDKNNSYTEFNKLDNKLDNLLFILKKSKYTNVMLNLKNKHVNGLRIEAKGRLTKRLTASRAIYKLSYKGSLKNIYSSYNKLSTIILRGLHKSNIQYLNSNSNNRNGSYGIKYWLSSY
jgi:hypothetical protein